MCSLNFVAYDDFKSVLKHVHSGLSGCKQHVKSCTFFIKGTVGGIHDQRSCTYVFRIAELRAVRRRFASVFFFLFFFNNLLVPEQERDFFYFHKLVITVPFQCQLREQETKLPPGYVLYMTRCQRMKAAE